MLAESPSLPFASPFKVFACFSLPVLVKLKKQDGRCVKKTPFIRPICLPDKGMKLPDGYCCTISGWGHMDESE